MICCQFIFTPGVYDDEFHKLDDQIDAYARSLPGFQHIEEWQSKDGQIKNAIYYFSDRGALSDLARFPQHIEAKANVGRWYHSYRIVVSEVTASYGDAQR